MSDEENKAIEMLRNYDNEDNLHKIHQSINVILNIIEKQQKEIEELKEENKKYIVQLTDEQYRKLVDIIRGEISKEWKDKIKAKIEEIDKEIEVKREIAKNPMDKVSGRLLTDSIVELEKAKRVLQSLLEKE